MIARLASLFAVLEHLRRSGNRFSAEIKLGRARSLFCRIFLTRTDIHFA